MNSQEPIQAEEDEISLIDILLFLLATFSNVVKSLVVCLLAGGTYYFSVPKIYEATAAIEMATVGGEPVENPAALLEKIKLPLYFLPATLQACGTDGELNSQAKFVDKIKLSINKSAAFVSFVTQAPSPQEAKACLNAVIAEVSNKQDAIAEPLLLKRKQKIQFLSDRLNLAEEIRKTIWVPKGNSSLSDAQFSALNLHMFFRTANDIEINDCCCANARAVAKLSHFQSTSLYKSDKPPSPRKIYVAGHRGMAGSAIVRALQNQGETNIVTRTHADVQQFFAQEKPTQVYLAAAKVGGIHANNAYPADFIYQNLVVQANVIDAEFRNGVQKLLFLGSSCIYPRMAAKPCAKMPYSPYF